MCSDLFVLVKTSSCSILNELQLLFCGSPVRSVTVVESTGDESMNQLLLVCLRHKTLHSGYVLKLIEGCFGDGFDKTAEGQI